MSFRDLSTSVRKIRDHICEKESKVGEQMWLQIFCARVGKSRTEISVSRNLGPQT